MSHQQTALTINFSDFCGVQLCPEYVYWEEANLEMFINRFTAT